MQAQGQALFNQQKLTNLALMLETEYLSRQNKLVSEITRKLNYQVSSINSHLLLACSKIRNYSIIRLLSKPLWLTKKPVT